MIASSHAMSKGSPRLIIASSYLPMQYKLMMFKSVETYRHWVVCFYLLQLHVIQGQLTTDYWLVSFQLLPVVYNVDFGAGFWYMYESVVASPEALLGWEDTLLAHGTSANFMPLSFLSLAHMAHGSSRYYEHANATVTCTCAQANICYAISVLQCDHHSTIIQQIRNVQFLLTVHVLQELKLTIPFHDGAGPHAAFFTPWEYFDICVPFMVVFSLCSLLQQSAGSTCYTIRYRREIAPKDVMVCISRVNYQLLKLDPLQCPSEGQ